MYWCTREKMNCNLAQGALRVLAGEEQSKQYQIGEGVKTNGD